MDPASPPHTPLTASPISNRKPTTGAREHHQTMRHSLSSAQRFAGLNNRRQLFSKTPEAAAANGIPFRPNSFRPDELSPRSSESSDVDDVGDDNNDEDNDEDGDNEDQSDADTHSSASSSLPKSSAHFPSPLITSRTVPRQKSAGRFGGSGPPTPSSARDKVEAAGSAQNVPRTDDQAFDRLFIVEATIIIEEITDYDNDNACLQVILPYAIEEAESEQEETPIINPNRSRKLHFGRSRRRSSLQPGWPPGIDRTVVNGLQDFSLRTESDDEVFSDGEDEDEANEEDEIEQVRLRQREARRHRRMTSGSIGKRTITESIGSGSDNEDLHTLLDDSEAGSSARRLRRRIGDRHSLQFSDPPPPRIEERIEELEEPDTTDNDDDDDVRELIRDGETLAELPYYTLEYISMEVDSP